MGFFSRITCLMLLVCGIFFLVTVSAHSRQSSSPTAASALNQQQKRGKGLFLQNCSFCHLPQNENPKSTAEGTTIGPTLQGRFREAKTGGEAVLRKLILQGSQRMPGFQYALELKEINDILAYLKTF